MKRSRLPPRVTALISIATVVPMAALLWFFLRVLAQDRALEDQQIRQRIEQASDIVTAALQRAVAVSERRLLDGSKDWPQGAVVMVVKNEDFQIWPEGRVAYLPSAPRLSELPSAPFIEGETIEFRIRDLNRAVSLYQNLSRSDRPEVRIGALLRLARCLRSIGKNSEALSVYSLLLNEDGWTYEGIPVSLVAQQARCSLLESMGQKDNLRREAAILGSDLSRGRWPVTRAVAKLYAQDVALWGKDPFSGRSEPELLAAGLAAFWDRIPDLGSAASGRESFSVNLEDSVVAVWIRTEEQLSVLIATSMFVSEQWLGAIASIAREQRVGMTLHNESRGLPLGVVRRADETNLPWTVVVTSSEPDAEQDQYRRRRQLLVSGFLILVVFAVFAIYLIFRATGREISAARLQSDFVSAVSHEFRTPLTSLRQFTDMLRKRKNLSDERREVCYEAQARSVARLTRLVESLLDFGRMEEGARIYHLEPLDCGELVKRVVEEFRRETQSSGFEIRVTVRERIEIAADREALGRALWNLLDNAVKYSEFSREIDVTVDRIGRDAAISVEDRGLGISAQEQAIIFHKFRRGEEATRIGIKGTGIGLTMVSHIMKAHHGRIEVRSELGRGSTFTLVLPIRR